MKRVSWGLTLAAVLVLLAAQLGVATPAASAAPATNVVHVVRWGENLFRIALRYGTTVQAIATANGIANPHCIRAGQRLIIPTCTSGCCTGCCGHGCYQHGFWYKVRCGDTLSGLSWRYGVGVWAIVHANPGIVNPNLIYAGQHIYIP